MSFITKSKFSILITGGGSGIGLALAKRFVKKGHEVIIVGRRLEQLQKAKDEVPSLQILQGDVSNDSERIKLVETILQDYPQVIYLGISHMNMLINLI